ncbi:hypothetical protein Bca52824_063584 [Brassica carinata]|uniref:Uncharacterized protein n=1 Tax=Brassica carinata TaxID=52824 RepID=A0A8X7QEM4_BRACI|nr:hypothetical protein Bca52824_063584 [Brassica carinata]
MIRGPFIKEDMVRPGDPRGKYMLGVEELNTKPGLMDSTSRTRGILRGNFGQDYLGWDRESTEDNDHGSECGGFNNSYRYELAWRPDGIEVLNDMK